MRRCCRRSPGCSGRKISKSAFAGYFETFPEFHVDVEDRILGGDKLVARLRLQASHVKPIQLAPNAPPFQPTGKKLAWGAIDIWRVANGKFVEHWGESDLAGL